MKHFFLIMAALLSLAACSRNSGTDEPAPQPLSSPVGTWKYTGRKYINGANSTVFNPYAASNCEGQDTFVFKADGTAVETEHSLSGSNCIVDSTTNYTYSYNAQTKELTFTRNGGTPDTFEVIKLDNNTLEYVYNISDENGDGVPDKQVLIWTRAN